jgi:hypothetical protein
LCQKSRQDTSQQSQPTQCNYYKVEKWAEDVAKVERVPGKAGHHRRR